MEGGRYTESHWSESLHLGIGVPAGKRPLGRRLEKQFLKIKGMQKVEANWTDTDFSRVTLQKDSKCHG